MEELDLTMQELDLVVVFFFFLMGRIQGQGAHCLLWLLYRRLLTFCCGFGWTHEVGSCVTTWVVRVEKLHVGLLTHLIHQSCGLSSAMFVWVIFFFFLAFDTVLSGRSTKMWDLPVPFIKAMGFVDALTSIPALRYWNRMYLLQSQQEVKWLPV